MYIILSYDVEAERTQIFKKISEQFLHRVQNSVFEGHITEAKFMRLSGIIKNNLRKEESVIIWIMESKSNFKKITYGKNEEYNFL
ncbi:MAG: CRISPR-associated endonuclease Cas2 [Candidatus Micrarchaeaceae archaeon]